MENLKTVKNYPLSVFYTEIQLHILNIVDAYKTNSENVRRV